MPRRANTRPDTAPHVIPAEAGISVGKHAPSPHGHILSLLRHPGPVPGSTVRLGNDDEVEQRIGRRTSHVSRSLASQQSVIARGTVGPGTSPGRRLSDRLALILAFLTLLLTTPAPAADTLPRAIRANDVAAVQAALDRHEDPNQRLAFGATPLGWAVDTQNPDLVAALLVGGARPGVADIDGITPLALACELGNPAIVTKLLDAHADVRAARPDGTTALMVCARFGPADAVARMLAAGAAADHPDSRGQTPLMWAAAAGRVEAIALLLKAGADPNRVTKAGFTPLFFAIKSGAAPAVATLLAAGARSDYRGPENTGAAQLALYQHAYAAAALIVERGADLAERDRTGQQLLHAAAEGGDTALVALLLAKGADPNALTGPSRIHWVTEANFGMPPPPVPPTPPLLLAAAAGHTGVMKLLLAAGADPRFVTEDGTNIVLAAARGGSAAALEAALAIAPDANVANARGLTALHLLVGGGVTPELGAMLRLLAAHGARPDIKSKRGATAAAMAADGLTEVKTIFEQVFPAGAPLKLTEAGTAIARPH
jgi:ankyrin repeat protein